jgi:hypothetical protein
MRRQLRERRREREARLLDLGALVYELHRQGKRAPELLQEKAAELSVIDEQVRELEAALDGDTGAAGGEQPYAGPAEPEHEGDDADSGLADAGEADEAPESHERPDDAQTEEADALDLPPDGDEERPA